MGGEQPARAPLGAGAGGGVGRRGGRAGRGAPATATLGGPPACREGCTTPPIGENVSTGAPSEKEIENIATAISGDGCYQRFLFVNLSRGSFPMWFRTFSAIATEHFPLDIFSSPHKLYSPRPALRHPPFTSLHPLSLQSPPGVATLPYRRPAHIRYPATSRSPPSRQPRRRYCCATYDDFR